MVYTAPCESAVQSGKALAQTLEVKCKHLDDLRNVDQGLWQGMLVDDVKLKQPKVYRQWQEQPETVCPPEGETISAVRVRFQQALAKIAKKQKGGVAALVVPEPLTSVVRNVLSNDELGDLWNCVDEEQPGWELFEVPATATSA